MTGFVILSTFIISLISFFSRKWNANATVLISLIVIILAGMRVGGFDYYEYVDIIEALQSNASVDLDVSERLFIAKDPMMLLIIDLAKEINDHETWPVFLSIAILSIGTKTIAALTLKRYSAIFISAYAILLSHGLEFAAIRSALAVGFIILALLFNKKIYLSLSFWMLAIASHISAITFIFGILPNKYFSSRKLIIILITTSAAASYIASHQIGSIERADQLANNPGNIAALFFPLATLFIFLAQIFSSNPSNNNFYKTISIGLGAALGLSIPAVTISLRIMEMSWCLLMFSILRDASHGNFNHGKKYAFFCAFMFFLLLCLASFFRPSFSALFTQIQYDQL